MNSCLRRLAVCLLLLTAAAGCNDRAPSPGQTAGPTTPLRVGFISAATGLPGYAAIDAGLFEMHGFVLQKPLVRAATSDLAIAALQNGEVDLILCAGIIQALEAESKRPGSLLLLAVLPSESCLVARIGDGAPAGPSDLDGRTVARFPGSAFEHLADALFDSLDVHPMTVAMSPKAQPGALQNGEVDALFTLEPTGAVCVAEGWGSYLTHEDLLATRVLGTGYFPGGCIAVSKRFIDEHPAAKNELVAVLQEAADLLATQQVSQSDLLVGYASVSARHVPHVTVRPALIGPNIEPDILQRLVDHLIDYGELPSTFEVLPLLP